MNPTPRRTVNWRAGLFLALIVGLGIAGLVAAKRGDWENVFVPAGERLMAGQNIFQGGYVYPPFQALVAAPFAALPQSAARIAWTMLNAASAGVFILGAWRLTGGDSLWKKEEPARREWWIFTLGFVAAIGFIFDAITNGQTDLLVAALITSGCLLLPRSGAGGGALIGLAAAAKCTPLLFLPWLVLRRRWMAAVCLLLAALIVNLLPDLIFPSSDAGLRLVRWAGSFLTPLLQPTHTTGVWFTAPEFNHSLAGWLHRLVRPDLTRPALLLGAGAALLVTAWTMLRGPTHEATANSSRESFEIGIIVCLMLLLSPASSKPHFAVLLLPAWAVARSVLMRRDRALLAVSIMAAVAGLVMNKDLVGTTIYDAAKWIGVITLETLLLFSGCVWGLHRERHFRTSPDECVDLKREGR